MSRFDRLYTDPDYPYLIAEVGGNHEGSLQTAVDMVEAAAKAGADAVKFQWYKADRLVTADAPAYWDTSKESATTQRALFERCDGFGYDDYRILAHACREAGVDFLCTPFDPETVPILDDMGVPAFKIASADITNLPLLEAVDATQKPILLSTGASDLTDIRRAISSIGLSEIGLLHCVLNYPTHPGDANLLGIETLRLDTEGWRWVGWSDHVQPIGRIAWAVVTAYLLGARIIEKHFTLDYSLPGNDHYHSWDPKMLRATREVLAHTIRPLLGDGDRSTVPPHEEEARRQARRSLVTTRDLPKGHVLTREDLTLKRPGTGLPPDQMDRVVGMPLTRAIPADTTLQADHVAATAHV